MRGFTAVRICVLWLLTTATAPSGAVPLTIFGKDAREVDAKIHEGMDLLYKENFSGALKLFEGVRKQYPDHPVGYFLKAAALDARMYFFYSARDEAEFNRNCEKAIEVGEVIMQKNPGDKWNAFFTGGAYGYLGTFQTRYKKYITSFRNGWTGVSYLKQVYDLDRNFVDALYGLGLYHYWSSKMAKLLWWMPGIQDKREEGIDQLKKVMEQGQYTALPAATNLMWIFLAEGRYAESMEIAQKYLVKYPNNRVFSFGLAELYFWTEKYGPSEQAFQKILDYCDSEDYNNNVSSLKCRLFLARIYEKQKLWVKAAAECRRGLAYRYNETDMLVTQDFQAELKEILGRVGQYYRPQR